MKLKKVRKTKALAALSILVVFYAAVPLLVTAATSALPPPVPTPGMVTMLDIGAKACVPCKMMAPILEQLEKELLGKASIVFIDVWKNPTEGPRFGIRVIPTQIFYDRSGKEVLRHEGFMDKKSIVSQLEKMGVK